MTPEGGENDDGSWRGGCSEGLRIGQVSGNNVGTGPASFVDRPDRMHGVGEAGEGWEGKTNWSQVGAEQREDGVPLTEMRRQIGRVQLPLVFWPGLCRRGQHRR